MAQMDDRFKMYKHVVPAWFVSVVIVSGLALFLYSQSVSIPTLVTAIVVASLLIGATMAAFGALQRKQLEALLISAKSSDAAADKQQIQRNGSMLQLAAAAQGFTQKTTSTLHTKNQMADAFQQIRANSDEQHTHIQETKRILDYLNSTVAQITDRTKTVMNHAESSSVIAADGNREIKSAVTQMHAIQQSMATLSAVITELGNRSSHIGSIVEVITQIAQQTNLLALNAAIESARAGEAGKGFAVVAAEVRKLAEQSNQSAGRIADYIGLIQNDIQSAIKTMEVGTKEVTTGIDVVHTAGSSFDRIQLSVKEVAAHLEEVFLASEQLQANSGITTGVRKIEEAMRSNRDLSAKAIAELQAQTSEMRELAEAAAAVQKLAAEVTKRS